jgi:polysaccharide biosynthesis protein PslH
MQFLGFVDSVAEFYAGCTLVVAPLLSGGGVKVKVAEAMAYGKVVVTTPVGAEGIPGLDGESICVCSAEAMPRVISQLLADPALRLRIGTEAALSAQQQFGCEAWLARADQRLQALVVPAP